MSGRDWRSRDWLVVDDESGHTIYASESVKRWDGLIVRKDQNEYPHPQWFVRSRNDPRPVPFVRRDPDQQPVCTSIGVFIPGTGVRRPRGAASHLKVGDDGIGSMQIGCSFVVDSGEGR
jgi:hypothetical protein